MTETAEKINNSTNNLNQTLRAKEVYDPRIFDNENTSKSLWTSKSVELGIKGLAEGFKLRENPFLKSLKGTLLRKSNLPFEYSEEELKIHEICMKNKEFFCDNFGKLKDGEKGWTNIVLRPYQRNLLKRYTENLRNIIMFPRQSGKTTTTVLEIVHFAIYNIDKDIVVIAQSDKVVKEILAKIKEAFAGLPFFMQPGFISFNKQGFALDNGCRLSIGIAAESVVQGFALDFLYIDEFAYIKASMVEKFWTNIYPTLVNNPKSKCIITSTPNGRNKFYQIWTAAEAKLSRFVPYRIYWHDVPGHDEIFKAETIAEIGIEGWEMGFECSFDTQLRSIFGSSVQKRLRVQQLKHEPLWSRNNHSIGNEFNIEFISQNVVKYDLKNDYFLIGADLGEGLEQDSSVLKIKKIDWSIEHQKLTYTSIGILRDNTIAVDDFAIMNMDLSKHFTPSHIQFVVENNTYGGEYFLQIDSLKINNPEYAYFENSVFAKFHRESKKDYERGIRWNGQNKKLGVKSFSTLVSSDTLIETHSLSIEEYLNFSKQKNGTYSAQYGHDDLVMADVSISHFIKCNNLYSVAFLNGVKEALRLRYNDEDIEIRRQKAEKLRKEKSVYTYNGFSLRNHDDHVEKDFDNLYLFGMLE